MTKMATLRDVRTRGCFFGHVCGEMSSLLTRFEVARLLGMRSLELSEGATPLVIVESATLRQDPLYVAARELEARALDARLIRSGSMVVDVRAASLPPCLFVLLDTMDNGTRGH